MFKSIEFKYKNMTSSNNLFERKSYTNLISALYEKAIEKLNHEGIDLEIIDYRVPHRRPRRPGGAFSNFIINREMGDWAENILIKALNDSLTEYRAIKYGRSGKLIAGDPGFKEFFIDYHEEVSMNGKRPDILLFSLDRFMSLGIPEDISDFEWRDLPIIANKADVAIEIRSSKYNALKYEKVKGKPQSFTPKLEDLAIVMRWIIKHQVPLYYAQVFFDSVFLISFERILQVIIDTGTNLINQFQRNQAKSTFYIPLTEGKRIGTFTIKPTWEGRVRETEDGRIEPYVSPIGGKLEIIVSNLREYIGI